MKKQVILLFVTLITFSISYGQQVIRLYPDKAPGSETWDWQEQSRGGNGFIDVTDPTLTAFLPQNPNGVAVIIAPGGAFHSLAFENEGTSVAKELNEKNITAFVLKYRLVHEDPEHPFIRRMYSGDKEQAFHIMDSVSSPVIPLMLQDGLTAVKYVREHAAEYKIDTDKIGFMGFSAGGTVTMLVAYNGTGVSHPNFVAPIYGYAGLVTGGNIPSVRTPLFVCAATDDNSVPPSHSLQFYSRWSEAKQPAEIHMYAKGGHGFGTRKQNLPVDAWLDRFADWILLEYVPKK